MAVKINAGDVKRVDLYHVDPFEVIVREELRGRHTPPTEEQITQMALSMMEHGQRQPVECRKIEGNRLLLVLGFTRNAAARLIRTGFKHPETGEDMKDENFRLKTTITDANDKQAFINNVVENAHRNQTSFIDDAKNQHQLRDKYGYNDAEITKLYQYSDKTKVGRLRRLLALPDKAQALVHEGKMTMTTALDILDVSDETARNERFEQAYADAETNGKVNSAEIRASVRDILNDDHREFDSGSEGSTEATGNGKKGPKAKPRTVKEIKKLFQAMKDEEAQDELVQKFCVTMLAWIDGKRKDERVEEAIQALLDGERS